MIAKNWRCLCWQWTGGLVGLLSIGLSEGVLAQQVVPDNTLGAESSVVTPDNIQGIESDRIDGGATRGANLFHSFQEFNVGESRGVYFANPTGIENILTRVTGSNPSNLLGRLGVLGEANLFLLNPNGIIYGPNAQLDVQGSFVGSTASGFTFANGSFSATNPQAPPLLAISVPLGLQYGKNPGSIQVQGSNLQVSLGKTFALVGGSVSMDGAQIQAPSGRIELGGVGGESTVGLTITGANISLSFPLSDSVPRSDVFLDNGTIANVSGSGDGNLTINAQNLEMARGSGLRAGASWLVSSNTNPGTIEINATGAINLTGNSFIENLVFNGATGKGGDINITAGALSVTNNAQLRADSFGKGDAGNLNIITRDGVSFDGIGSTAESVIASEAQGQGGKINITTRSLSVSGGATLVAHTSGTGNAGDVTIRATDAVSLEGSATGIGSQVFAGAEGKGGSIKIATRSLSVSDGATLVTNTFGLGDGGSIDITTRSLSASNGATLVADTSGTGNAGDVTINATDAVSLEGASTAIGSQVFAGAAGNGGKINITTGTLSASDGAALVANTSGQGDGGKINITTGTLSAFNGATLVAHTSGTGNAGDVTIRATDAVSLEGSATGIGSQVFAEAEGNGGSINVTTRTLSVSDGATLVISTADQGNGGKINITTGTLSVSNGATLVADTSGKGNAGDVTIRATDAVSLEGSLTSIGSQVSAGAEGNGGKINIATGNLSVSDGATFLANTSGGGNAGNVTIKARDTVSFQGASTAIGSQVFHGSEGDGGNIDITTGNLSVSDGATFVANISGAGNAGNVTIKARDTVTLQGSNTGIGSQVFPGARGSSGSINITTGNLFVSDGAVLVANSFEQGNAGNVTIRARDTVSFQGSNTGIGSQVFPGARGSSGSINITTGNLFVSDGAVLVANSFAQGNAGDVTIRARDTVSLQGSSTGISTQVSPDAKGNGGNINIVTGSLSASDGATLVTNTSGLGDAGDVTIRARDAVSLQGVGIDTQVTGIGSQVLANAVGNGGKIDIKARSLAVTNGARLIASSSGNGNGGDVNIVARDTVSFDEVGSNGISSGVFSSAEVGAIGEGKGGDISIKTDTLRVSNGAVLDAKTQSNFKAGNIMVKAAESVDLNQASLLAQSNGTAPAGNITINTGNLTARNSTITTSSQQSAGGGIAITASTIRLFDSDITTNVNSGVGGGGNIMLTADSIIAFDDSDILAFAREGSGGAIKLNTPAFFGENYRPAPSGTIPDTLNNNNRVDINATGAVNGIITIPNVSFIQNSLIELPDNQINTDSILANSCIVRRNQPTKGSFTVTGTGGLPQRPGDVQISNFPTVDVATLPSDRTTSNPSQNRSWQKGDPIVEPQGVYRLPNGKLVLSRECS